MLTCHFRHAGLKLGDPIRAPSSSVKTNNIGVSPGPATAHRAGRGFEGVVRRGKWLKRRRRGEGMAKMLRVGVGVGAAAEGSGGGSAMVSQRCVRVFLGE